MTDARYRRSLEELYGLRRFGMRPGLEVMRGLLEALGDPQERFRAIHVTGSKGKGSVAAMSAAILEAHGLKTGLFTSPHLQSYRERVRVGGRPVSRAAVVEGVERVQREAARLQRRGGLPRAPTFFEVTTALAFERFAQEGVQHAVVEVGIGGRLDSTNVLDSRATVVTTVELEHTEVLGPTLADIAREKAGIFRPGVPALVGETKAEPLEAIDRAAGAVGVPVWHLEREVEVEDRKLDERGQEFSVATPHRRFDGLRVPLFGGFQARNAALAVAAVERYLDAVGEPFDPDAVRRGLAAVEWRGRLERVGRRPEVFLDVAHTPESARAVAQALAEIFPLSDPDENAILFGCLSDKRHEELLEALEPLARTIVLVPVRSVRSAAVDALRRSASGRFPRIVVAPGVRAGLPVAKAATGPGGFLLVTGSDYLVGEALNCIEGAVEDEPDLSDPVGAALPAGPAPGRRPR